MNWPLTSRLVNTVASRPTTYLKKSCSSLFRRADQVAIGQCTTVDHRLVDVLLVEELATDDQRDVAGLGGIVERGAEVVDAVAVLLEHQGGGAAVVGVGYVSCRPWLIAP